MPSDAILNLSSMQRSVDVPKALSPSLYMSCNKCVMLNLIREGVKEKTS
jgi:hypothetical protein